MTKTELIQTLADAAGSDRKSSKMFLEALTGVVEKQIKRGAHASTRALESAIRQYIAVANEAPKPFVWTKTPDEILASVARFCHRISDSGH